MPSQKIFLDFDGTITRVDVGVMLLDRFGAPDWRYYDEQFEKGQISMRECLNNEWNGFKGTQDQIFQEIIPRVEIELGFDNFVKEISKKEIPLAIVSDGFKFYIREILERNNIDTDSLEMYVNQANVDSDGKVTIFYITDECEHGCANCKVFFVKAAQQEGYLTIYVGDGISDFYPAQVADIIFAKSGRSLERFCKEKKIIYHPFQDFYDILKILEQLL
ncbi:MAG: MtnX-like HAD-IB family phosphatase [Candidatus Hodarchaeota archaeon]